MVDGPNRQNLFHGVAAVEFVSYLGDPDTLQLIPLPIQGHHLRGFDDAVHETQ